MAQTLPRIETGGQCKLREELRIGRAPGFTVVEMIVAVAILGALAAFGMPIVMRTLHTAKMSTVGYDCNVLVRRAKSEAIKKNSPVVVRYDSALEVLTAFVDVHGATVADPPDYAFVPDAGVAPTATDHEVSQCALPSAVTWGGPSDDPAISVGFTTVGTENVAILEPDGTVQDIGTFRFGDSRGNYLAIQIAPAATARVTLLKWDEEDAKWREQGEEGKRWVWF
jgi:prepilin-type N-terminal cleavage/methylation domain-containing protein